MNLRLLAAASLGLCLAFAAGAEARPLLPSAVWSPETVANRIEQGADSTSFAKLDAFGRAALLRQGRDRLDRLKHVAWLFLNQSEFAKFDYWNGLLKTQAAADHDERYQAIAEINELRSKFDRGDRAAADEIRRRAGILGDWFARAHAKSTAAYVLVIQNDNGAALKLLYEADGEIPASVASGEAGLARAGIWESLGLALMSMHDLKGAAEAFGRQQFEFAPVDYPRPDFDGIYNMSQLAVELGEVELAGRLAAVHHRLATRSDLQGLNVWDANLCAMVAEHRSDSRAVLNCLAPLGENLANAQFLATKLLPLRAIARARLGQLALAKRDLARLEKLHAAKKFGEAQFVRMLEVKAEVERAQGEPREAFDALRSFTDHQTLAQAKSYRDGITELSQEMQKQLGARRQQLLTAQKNAALQQQIINGQHLAEQVGLVLVAIVLVLLVWQVRAASALRKARSSAEAANLAKSEFLANMSHEIRTPLNGVVAVADMLANSNLGPREREMIDMIRASGDTLQRLLSDILDLARIESGKITIENAPFHLGQMVRAVSALSKLRCDENGVALSVHIAPDLDGWVNGDIVRVRQVLGNFLSNAVKFTERGSIQVRVERAANGQARIAVSDTGVGFDPSQKALVMGRFQQADSSITRRFGGSGLGLSICAELAQLMGGHVDCDARPGEGATFWLEAPMPPAAAPDAAESVSETAVASDRLRILAADDHPTNRRVLQLMLSEIAQLDCVENGREALEALAAGPRYDLVLMDMQMPVMDGLSAVREIRRIEAAKGLARLPIVMLTANALAEHVADALAAGADVHLGKPFTGDTLLAAISEAIDGQALAADAA